MYVAFLRATPLLQALSSRAGVVPYLLRSSHLITRKIGETIVRVNASTSHLPIVYSGEILLTSGAPGRFSLLRVGPGQCIPCAPPASNELPACVACCTARVSRPCSRPARTADAGATELTEALLLPRERAVSLLSFRGGPAERIRDELTTILARCHEVHATNAMQRARKATVEELKTSAYGPL